MENLILIASVIAYSAVSLFVTYMLMEIFKK